MGDQQPETLRVHLSRPDSGMSWGFRLQGGVDFNTPLSVQVVQPKSIAERCGLKAGDGIIVINNTNTDGLTHEQSKMEIIRSSNDIDMTIIRGAVQIWRPKVTPLSDLRPNELQPIQTATGDEIYSSQRTSLAKEKQDDNCTIGSSYNRSAKPFGGQGGFDGGAPQYGGGAPQYGGGGPQYGGGGPQYGGGQYQQAPESPKRAIPNVVHAQFNTPIGLYSAGNIANSYAQQTAGINKEAEGLDVTNEPVGSRMTGTYQRLDSDQGQSNEYGTKFSNPTSPDTNPGDEVTPVTCDPSSGSAEPLQNNRSGSPECLQPENGVSSSNEHVPVQTNENINNSQPQFGGQSSQPSGFRSVTAPQFQPPAPGSAPKQESMHCNGCGNMVTGVFVRVKGLPYHEKCFKCFNCGVFLKQKGYFMIEGELYCEIHARRAAEAPGDNMRAAGAVYR